MLQLIKREFEVAVTPEVAWRHLAQIERWPSWAKHIRTVELTPSGALTPESSGHFLLKNGIRSTFRVVQLSAFQGWKWVGPFLWLTVHYDHRFEPIGQQGTRLTWMVDAEGVGVGLVGRLYAVIYNRNLDIAIPNLIREMNTSNAA